MVQSPDCLLITCTRLTGSDVSLSTTFPVMTRGASSGFSCAQPRPPASNRIPTQINCMNRRILPPAVKMCFTQVFILPRLAGRTDASPASHRTKVSHNKILPEPAECLPVQIGKEELQI